MRHKLKQQLSRAALTQSNRLPNTRARKYLINTFRAIRRKTPSGPLRASIGLVLWSQAALFHNESRIAHRASCFLTGRSRGTSHRFAIARTRLKEVASNNLLFGLRKSGF